MGIVSPTYQSPQPQQSSWDQYRTQAPTPSSTYQGAGPVGGIFRGSRQSIFRPDAQQYMDDVMYQAWKGQQAGARSAGQAASTAWTGNPNDALAGLGMSAPQNFSTGLTQSREMELAEKANSKELTRAGGLQNLALTGQNQLANQMIRQIPGFMGAFGMSSGEGGAGGGGPQINAPDTSVASAAAFARAKDLAGKNTRSAVDSLRDLMASGNMLGSGAEAAGYGNILTDATSGMNDIAREQAIQEAIRAGQVADETYQGGITMRGQDLANRNNYISQIMGLLQAVPTEGPRY